MALLNRPLTPDEVKKMLDATPLGIQANEFLRTIWEPHGQYVRYDAAIGRIVYEDRKTFYWCTEDSPGDSRWMVPGVPQERSFPFR